MFRVVVLLEGEPMPQSKVFCSLTGFQQVFFPYSSSFFLSTQTCFPVHAVQKHHQSIIVPAPCVTMIVGSVIFVPHIVFACRIKSYILLSSEHLILQVSL
ncbi:hypothetical protein AMECASPLE_027259 [Ameca splendens]|uniref:Uncharacterized protein n=1 Tax=Ameca splendens TaxID=208324 RepID=A0ABV0Z526_9TELE